MGKANIDWNNPEEVRRYHRERARSLAAKAVAQPTTGDTDAPLKSKDIKTYQHDYYEKNKDALKERRKKYYDEHKDDYKRRGKKNSIKYYQHFKDLPDDDPYKQERKRKIADNAKRYYEEHKQEILEKKRIRDAAKRNADDINKKK